MRRAGPVLLVAALLAGVVVAPRPALAAKEEGVAGPVAVLPFKNLNDDPKLDWLSVGIAETMLSDVKNSGRVQVVERDQIDKALAQIALQGEVKMAPATAVKVGRIVGARTIVLGAYQEAGGRVRITARFVSVETGVVKDAAKVTGPLTRIFHLQDAIVARLLGRRKGHRYHHPQREKGSARTVKAYRLYAMSLSVASDAQRVTYLKKAVQVDPHFHYATDALAALQRRMLGYEAAHAKATADRATVLRQALRHGTKKPPYLLADASRLLAYDQTHFDWYAYLDDARLIEHSRVPRHFGGFDRDQMVLFSRVLGNYMLRRYDLALQYGEAYLKRYPAGAYFGSVQYDMKCIIDQRHRAEAGKAKLAERLETIARQRANARKRMTRYPQQAARQLMSLDYQACQAYEVHDQYQAAVGICQTFIDAHAQDHRPWVQKLVGEAYVFKALALSWLGRFDEAWKVVDAAKSAKLPGVKAQMKEITDTWPPRRSP